MDTKDFAGYYGNDGQAIEYIDERFPDFDARATLAFVVEAIDYYQHQLTWGYKPLVTFAHSWLPRRRKKFSGHRILRANSKHTVSKLCRPEQSEIEMWFLYLYQHNLLRIGSLL
jgi:hypothetical protein